MPEFLEVDPKSIIVPEGRLTAHQDEDSSKAMGESYKRFGIIQEVGVRRQDDGLSLIYGGGRLSEAIEADAPQITVKCWDVGEEDAELMALAENLGRGQIVPGEYVRKIAELVHEKHMAIADVAELVNRPPAWVKDIVEVSDLDPEITELLVTGDLPLEHAKQLRRVQDHDKRLEVLRMTMSGSWSTEALRAFIDHWVFKQCDGCRQEDRELLRVGSELICAECIGKKYPELAARLEGKKGATLQEKMKVVDGDPQAVAPGAEYKEPCHLCAQETVADDLRHLTACASCLKKVNRFTSMLEVYTGQTIGEVSLEGLTHLELRIRGQLEEENKDG